VGHVKNKYYIWIKQCNWYIIDEFVAVQKKWKDEGTKISILLRALKEEK